MKKVTLFVRLMMITMLSLFFGFQIGAQNVIDIGTYAGTISYMPFYGYYNYGFSKCIYKTTDFGSTDPKLITKIGYKATTQYGGTDDTENLTCWMKEVSENGWTTNTFPNDDEAMIAEGWTLVWSGDHLPFIGWNEFELINPYVYSGQQNLAVAWRNLDGYYPTNRYVYWERFTGTTNQSVYRYFDSPIPPPFPTGYYTTYVPRLRVYYYAPALGTVYGTVTDAITGDPVVGALTNATNLVGSEYTFTDGDGMYSLTLYTIGTPTTVTVQKAGYETGIQQVIIPGNGTIMANFDLGEDKVPVSGVVAEVVQADVDVVKISWGIPEGFYEIIYDDGVYENLAVWQNPGSYNALKFTPDGYPCTIHYGSINIGDGTYPPGDILQPFNVAIFDDNGANGYPGTMLAEIEVTPTSYGWVLYDLEDKAVVIPSGSFYVAMEQGGTYPDCAPIGVDETSPVFRSYQKFETGPWVPSAFNDFMIRVVVSSPGGQGGTLALNPEQIQEPKPHAQCYSLLGAKTRRGYEGEGIFRPLEGQQAPRDLSHYKVFRMNEGDENNPSNWTLLAGFVTNNFYFDNAWISIPNGGYRWAVVAVYDSGDSPAALSNLLGKNWVSQVTFNLTNSAETSCEGAIVTMLNQDGLPEHTYQKVCGASQTVVFPQVWHGTYDMEVFQFGFDLWSMTDDIYGPATYDVYLLETKNVPRALFVDPLTLLATWVEPGVFDGLFETFDAGQPAGWTVENLGTCGSSWIFVPDRYGSTLDGTPFALIDADANGSGCNTVGKLTSPALNAAGVPALILEFDWFYQQYIGSDYIDVLVYNGSQWVTILHQTTTTGGWGAPNHRVLDVSEYANTQFKVQFFYDAGNTWAWWTALDNVKVHDGVDRSRGVIGYNVYTNDFITGFTSNTYWQYDPTGIEWGVEYTTAVNAVYQSGVSDKIFYTWTSVYLPPPENLQGEDVGHTAYLTWEQPGGGGGALFWDFLEAGLPEDWVFSDTKWSAPGNGLLVNAGNGSATWTGGYYNMDFTDFIFEYKLTKTGGATTQSMGGVVRASTFMDQCTGYLCNIVQDGQFSVFKMTGGGGAEVIQGWTASGAINTGLGNYNIVTIIGSGPLIQFYCNGTLLYQFTDATYPTGKLIINNYDGQAGHNVNYDYVSIALPEEATVTAVNTGNETLNAKTFPGTPEYTEGPVFDNPRVPVVSPVHYNDPGSRVEYGELIGYNLYRDGNWIVTTDNETFEYYDAGLPAGYYDYEITASYDMPTPGESMVEGPITVYINGEGTIFGTVSQYGSQFIPIQGALVTATGQWGTWMAYTLNNGSYVLEDVVEGTYTMTCEAEGFETMVMEGVFLADEQELEVNFELLEFPYPPVGVTATLNDVHTQAMVDWFEYSEFYQIVYDDGEADNVTAWQKGGNMNALKFTPLAYPAQLQGAWINIFDGSWPTGANLQSFEVAVFAANGPGGVPGTELGRVPVDPFAYGWVDVNLAQLGLTFNSGDFYIAMVQGGDYPNCVPIAIDEDAGVFRSYSRDVNANEPWKVAEFADFMIRATMYDESRGTTIIGYSDNDQTVTFESGSGSTLSLNPANVVPGTYEVGDGTFVPVKESENTRDIEDYTVFVLEEGDEGEPATWIEKATVTETEYLDTDWTSYAKGFYRYAVIANYTYNESDPAFSNVLANGYEHTLTLNVRTNDGSPAVGAQVLLARNDGDPNFVYSAIVPANGTVIFFKEIWDGFYDLSVTLDYFNPYFLQNIAIFNDLTLNVNLMEIFLPPACFNVDNMTGVATWCPPVIEYEVAFEEGFEGGAIPAGWSQEYVSETQTPWIVRTGSPTNVPSFAHEGELNAFFVGSTSTTRLVTPPLDLSYTIVPKLSFWHTQGKGAGQDELKVYYRTAPNAVWKTLVGYFEDIRVWKGETINLPSPTGSYQIAFMGDCGEITGHGICLDEIKVLVGASGGGREVDETRVLEGYNVYLNGILQAFTTELTYTYTDLVIGQFYVAGVQAVYTGGESIILEKAFTYYTCDYFTPPANFAGMVNGMNVILTWESPIEYPGIFEDFLDEGIPDGFLPQDDEWSAPGNSMLIHTGNNSATWSGCYYDQIYADFTFEYKVAKTGGDVNQSIGGVTRASTYADNCTGYLFNIVQSGQFSVFKFTGGGNAVTIQGWTASGAINTGLGSFNVVTIVGSGPAMEFYCNGQLLTAFSDADYPAGYLIVDNYDGAAGHQVQYDYYSIFWGRAIRPTGPNGVTPTAEPDVLVTNFSGTPEFSVGEMQHHDPVPAVGLLGENFLERQEFELLGFNIWRDGVVLNPDPLPNYVEQYIDHVSPGGIYYYNITAVYDFGQSCPIDPPFEAIVGAEFNPPSNLQAFLLENDDVLLTWSPPGAAMGEWITWDDGVYWGRVGLNGPDTWYNAHKYVTTDLIPYDDWYLTRIRFVPSDVEGICDYTLKVWTGANAANEVVSVPLTGLIMQEYNSVNLPAPVMIDATQELWMGLEMIQSAAGYPAGRDQFTNHDGKGNMLSFDAVEWEPMSVYGIAGDWNIQGYVTSEVDNFAPLTPLVKKEVTNSGDFSLQAAKSDKLAFAMDEGTRGLMGYNLWRNGANFTFVSIPDTSYTDMGLAPGEYMYYVSAVYDEGESFADGPAYATVTGRGTLKGYVFDFKSGAPIIGATISIPGGYSAQSGYDGRYQMNNVPAGTYNVTCVAAGYNTKVAYGVVIKHQKETVVDFGMFDESVYSLPFFEPWDEGEFEAQGWTFPDGMGNWDIIESTGNPPPAAIFNWSPTVEDYSFALVSPQIDATGAKVNVTLKFDLFLDAYSFLGNNFMTIEVWDGASWMEVAMFDDVEDIPWTTFAYDITGYAMGDLTQIRFVANGENSFDINWWYLDNIQVYESITYDLYGTVTELATGDPIEGAMIEVEGYEPVYSSSTGDYFITVEEGTYDIVCQAECFNPITLFNVAIMDDMMQDFELVQPILSVDPAEIVVDLGPYGIATEYITIANDGNGVMKWNASVILLNKEAVAGLTATHKDKKVPVNNSVREESPSLTHLNKEISREMWDVLFSFDVVEASGAAGNAGAEFDGQYFYSTRWASNLIHQYDKEGNLVKEFSVPGVSNLRDLAFDGQYLYGGAAGSTIYCFDPINEVLINAISTSGAYRAIAYDPELDGFWGNNWSGDILCCDRTTGAVLDIIPDVGLGGIYGLAYENIGGRHLWAFDQGAGAGTPQILYQIDIASGSLTGVTHDVFSDLPGGIAGGLFVTSAYAPGVVVIGGLMQGDPGNDYIFGYELATYDVWITLGAYSGTLAPGAFVEIPVFLNPEGQFEVGDVKEAEILVTEDLGCYEETVDVTMTIIVGDEELFTDGVINVYPNPATSMVNLAVTDDVKEIRVINYVGQVMDAMNVVDTKLIQLNTSSYATGTYLIEFRKTSGDVVTRSVVITR